MDELLAWVEDYCRMGGSVPCVGIADRAVPLCRARGPECGTAVLVPFYDDVQAFIPDYTEAGMVIVSVWRPEVHRSLIAYGGARKLLEAVPVDDQRWRSRQCLRLSRAGAVAIGTVSPGRPPGRAR